MAVAEAGRTSTGVDAPTDGGVDTVDEAIKSWLDQNGDVDLENLSKADLDALIQYLNSMRPSAFMNSEDFKALLGELKELQKNWPMSSGVNSLEVMRNGLNAQENFLGILAAATDGSDSIDVALGSIQAILVDLEMVADWLNSPTEALEGNPSAEMAEVLNAIQNLREAGVSEVQLGGMGLLGLEKALIEADKEYQSIMASDQNNKEALADSALRESMAQIKIAHAARMGVSPGDDFMTQQQGVVENERIWQQNLSMAWENFQVPPMESGGEYSRESLREYRERLRELLKLIPPGPDGELAKKLIETKIELTSSAIKDFPDSDSAQFGAGLSFALDLRVADLVMKKALLDEAKKAKPPNTKLIDKLEQDIAMIQSFNAALVDAISKALQAMTNSYNQLSQL